MEHGYKTRGTYNIFFPCFQKFWKNRFGEANFVLPTMQIPFFQVKNWASTENAVLPNFCHVLQVKFLKHWVTNRWQHCFSSFAEKPLILLIFLHYWLSWCIWFDQQISIIFTYYSIWMLHKFGIFHRLSWSLSISRKQRYECWT